jgi:hypothetical protein
MSLAEGIDSEPDEFDITGAASENSRLLALGTNSGLV